MPQEKETPEAAEGQPHNQGPSKTPKQADHEHGKDDVQGYGEPTDGSGGGGDGVGDGPG